MTKTWRELEAEGVKRCCAVYVSGRRCRRRAAPTGTYESGQWCAKHGPDMDRIIKTEVEALKSTGEMA